MRFQDDFISIIIVIWVCVCVCYDRLRWAVGFLRKEGKELCFDDY